MSTNEEQQLIVKFPEDQATTGTATTAVGTVLGATPNNVVDKAADFLPRALSSIKENFSEAVFLFSILGYIFIAAFGHMEKIQNYFGYFFVVSVSIIFYKMGRKITLKDILYLSVIIALIIFTLLMRYGNFFPRISVS